MTLFHVVCVRPVLTNATISFLLLMECLRTHSADRLFHSVVFQPRFPHEGTADKRRDTGSTLKLVYDVAATTSSWLSDNGSWLLSPTLLDPGTIVLSKYSCDGQLALSDGVVSLANEPSPGNTGY